MRLSDLKVENESLETDFENIPEEGKAFAPNLPAQESYTFSLPDVFEAELITTKRGQRIRIVFNEESPLTVVSSRGDFANGQTWQGSINNAEQNRARYGEPEVLVPDLLYLIRVFDPAAKPKTNKDYIEAIKKLAGKTFVAENTWTSWCNKNKTIYIDGENGQAQEDPEGRQGCGANYKSYSRGEKCIPRNAEGDYQERFPCKCGASLRAFQNLRRFRKADEIPF
jgi:hypothetical protein